MTIGPEPMTRTWLMSSRRGMNVSLSVGRCAAGCVVCCEKGAGLGLLLLLQQVEEVVEQGVCVVRAGGGLWVILHREGASAGQRNALDDVVVEADVGDLGGTEWRVEFLIQAAGGRGEGETVVLGGDRDLAGLEILHRHVGAAVAELQLVGVQAEGAAEDLVAEADTEERNVGLEYLLDLLHR